MTYFVTDGFNVLAELDRDLKLKAAYLHGPGIDNPLMMSQGNRDYYFHADRMGSISRVTDQEGRIAAMQPSAAFYPLHVDALSLGPPDSTCATPGHHPSLPNVSRCFTAAL